MLKAKLYILFTMLLLLISSVIAALFSFAELDWVKILILLPLFTAAFFVLAGVFSRFASVLNRELAALKEQLKEKRIKLKDEPELPYRQEPRVKELKGSLELLAGSMREKLNQQKQQPGGESESPSGLKELFTSFAENEEIRDKEIQDIQANYKTIAQNTNKAFTIADNLSTQAKSAFDLSGDVQEGVKVVNTVLQDAAEKSNKLFEQSKKISKIIEIISEISSKTHILSINASIVSARAGKDGKAFEVVSKEIRKLATETDMSLGEIEMEINKIQNIIRSVVQGINEANTKTMEERDQLTAVIGALQGVTLGVEVLRAVSNVVNSKTVKQKELIGNIIMDYKKILEQINSAASLKELGPVQRDLESHLSQLNQILSNLITANPADVTEEI